MIIKKIFFSFLILNINFFVFSQNSTLSPYSHFGFGKDLSVKTFENRQMGGVSVYADSTSFSFNNPSSLGKLDFIQYKFGADYTSSNQKSHTNSAQTSSSTLKYLALAVPTKFFAFSFGLMPKTSTGYRTRLLTEEDGLENTNLFQGTGGINSTFFSLAFNLTTDLSLGASASYNFGYIEKTNTRSISSVQLDTRILTRSELSGINYNLGIHYNKKVFKNYFFQISASYEPKSKLQSINNRTISTITNTGAISSQEDVQLGLLSETTNQIPSSKIFGFGFGKKSKWFFGSSYKVDSNGINFPLENIQNLNYISSKEISIGGFYIPKFDSFTNYFNTITYRLGAKWQQTGIVINEKSIKDFSISSGVGLPIGGLSKVNIGLEYGKTGTKSNNLIEENYIIISLGLSLSDIWFIKRKYD